MNKQEAIKLVKNTSYSVPINDSVKYLREETVIKIIDELDEPEKPVVPQFVADFYESIKDDFEDGVYDLCVQFNNGNDELSWWFAGGKNKPIETLVKMKLFGYEIEKEKLYTVEIPNPNSAGGKTVLNKQQSTGKLILEMLTPDINKPKYLHLTESEIKEDFEWAWQWAEEVKE